MVNHRSSRSLAALAAFALGGGCALVAGLEDKRLGPEDLADAASVTEGGPRSDATVNDAGATDPEIVLTGLRRPSALAVDVTAIYFAEETGGTVQRLPKSQKTATIMAGGQSSPRQILLDAQFVYWRNDNLTGDAGGPNSYPIMRLEKSKSAPAAPQSLWREDPTRMSFFRGIALYEPTDGRTENLLFMTREGRVEKKARDNEFGNSDITNTQNTPSVIVADDQFVYWVAEGEYAIRRQKKSPTGPLETLHTSADRVFAVDLAVDDQNVFWLDQLGRVFKKKKATDPAPPLQLAASESTATGSLSLTRDAVYWTNGDRGTVLTVPKNGNEQSKRVLAIGQAQPRGIAADTFDTPQRVYWVTATALLRLPL